MRCLRPKVGWTSCNLRPLCERKMMRNSICKQWNFGEPESWTNPFWLWKTNKSSTGWCDVDQLPHSASKVLQMLCIQIDFLGLKDQLPVGWSLTSFKKLQAACPVDKKMLTFKSHESRPSWWNLTRTSQRILAAFCWLDLVLHKTPQTPATEIHQFYSARSGHTRSIHDIWLLLTAKVPSKSISRCW